MQYSRNSAPSDFIHKIFPRKENFFEVENKGNPTRLSVIFSTKVVPYSQTSNLVYNIVRNEIRRIDNFGERNKAKGKNINWIVEYTHPSITIKATGIKADSSTNFFIFLPPLNLRGKAARICKCWFDDVVSCRGGDVTPLLLTWLLSLVACVWAPVFDGELKNKKLGKF